MTYNQQETILRNAEERAVQMLRERSADYHIRAQALAADGNLGMAQALVTLAQRAEADAAEIESALRLKYPKPEEEGK